MFQGDSPLKFWQLFVGIFLMALLTAPVKAELVLYTSLGEFIRAAEMTDALITDSFEITRATEVSSEPTQNQNLGSTLEFRPENTQFPFRFTVSTVESGANFTFEDFENANTGPPANFFNALSVGDLDDFENDDWVLDMTVPQTVSAIGFEVRDNNFQDGSTTNGTQEFLTALTTVPGETRVFDLSALNLGSPGAQFIGVVATAGERIRRIEFDEDSGGDDIAIADFRFGGSSFGTTTESFATNIEPRRFAANGLTLDNQLLITGGFPDGDRGSRLTEMIDLGTGESEVVGDMVEGRYFHTLTMLPDGNFLAVGGRNSTTNSIASAEIFDVDTKTWRAVASVGQVASSHSVTRLFDGRLLFVNGPSYQLFDPTTEQWTAPMPMNAPRSSHAATLALDGKVWVTGGNLSQETTSIYDPENDTWSAGPNMNTGRFGHNMVTLPDGRLAVVGQVNGSDDTCTGGLEILDPSENSPTWDDSFSDPVFDKCAPIGGVLPDGRMYAGRYNDGNGQSELEIYDLERDRWNVRLTGFSESLINTGIVLPTGKLAILQFSQPLILDLGYDTVTNIAGLSNQRTNPSTTLIGPRTFLVMGGGFDDDVIVSVSSDGETANVSPCENCPTNDGVPIADQIVPIDGMSVVPYDVTGDEAFSVIMAGGLRAPGNRAEIYRFVPSEAVDSDPPELIGMLRQARRSHRAHVLFDGRMLVIGGINDQATAKMTAEVFNPQTGLSEFTGSLNTEREFNFDSVLMNDGRVMVAGGLTATQNQPPEIYNPLSNQWRPTAPFNEPRSAVRLAMLSDGRVMAAGGSQGLATNIVEIYDPATGVWEQVSSMSQPRINFTLTTLPNGLVLAAGGASSAAAITTEIYDPATDEWTSRPRLSGHQSHAAVHLDEHRLAIFGGSNSGSDDVLLYAWNETLRLNTEVTGIGFTPSIDGNPDGSAFVLAQLGQLWGGGDGEDFAANGALLLARRIDNGAQQWLKPLENDSWLSTSRFDLDIETFPRGLVWISGILNGIPIRPDIIFIAYDPVSGSLCFPVTTTQGDVTIVCL
ncbi:MAG: kelch repeat-containing protein [Pseudomonadota bacterium]